MKSYLHFSALVLLILPFLPSSALGAPALNSIPDAVKSKYSFNGTIEVMVTDGSTLYVGGAFTTVSTVLGDPVSVTRNNLAAIDLTTYTLTDFDPDIDSTVNEMVLSSDGGTLYIGGEFFCVGGVDELFNCEGDERFFLAAIDTTTGAATAFNPIPDSSVYALALSSDDTTLYIGGDFGDINEGTARDYLAAVATADGVATAFDPDLQNSPLDIVLSSDDAVVYAVGGFTNVNGGNVAQRNLVALDATTGGALNFNASLDGTAERVTLSSDDATLYVGEGSFTEYRLAGAAGVFDESTEEPVRPFPIVSGGTIIAALSDGEGGWYIGGNFTHVGTTSQPRLAHITSAGVIDPDFNPDIDAESVLALALSPDGATLYAGGTFNLVDNGTVRNYVAAFTTADGSTTAFDPDSGATVHALALSSDGGTLYMGGEFGTLDGGATFRNYVGAFDTAGAGTATAFDPDADTYVYTLALSEDDSTLFMGGAFTTLDGGGTARNHVAAFDTTGAGTVTAFNPNADNNVFELTFGPGETTIYAGGSFANIGGEVRAEFAELDVTTGAATALDAGIIGGGTTVEEIALSSDENTIYIGGSNFSEIGGQTRQRFAEIDATTGLATSFDPTTSGSVYALAVSTTTTELLLGGNFVQYAPTPVSNLIAIDTSDASLVTTFEPEPNDQVSALALTFDDALLYAGGDFTSVNGGTARDHIAAFDTTDGDATAFSPDIFYGITLALKADASELYVGSYDADDTGETELLVFDVDGDDDGGGGGDDEEEEGGGGGGDNDSTSSRRGTSSESLRGGSQTNILFILLSRLQELLREIIALGGTVPPEAMQYLNMPISRTDIYLRNLTVGDEGGDVTALQNFLIAQNKGPAAQALAAHGATGYFGPLTRAALAEYQAALKIDPAVGYFGPITRGVVVGQ